MKKFSAILIIGLMCFLLPAKTSSAQAVVEKNGEHFTFTFYEKENGGVVKEWTTDNHASKTTIAANGNIVKHLYFQLDDDHPLMGSNAILIIRVKLDDETYLVDEKVDLKKDGSFKVTFHKNAAGQRFPVGWILD